MAIVIIHFSVASIIVAQTSNPIFLLEALDRSKELGESENLYRDLINHYRYENRDSAILIANRGIVDFTEKNYHQGVVHLRIQLARVYNYRGDLELAQSELYKAMDYSLKHDSINLRLAYTEMGNNYGEANQYDSCSFYFHKALELGPQNNYDGFMRMHYQLAEFQIQDGLIDKAEENLLKVYQEKERTSDLTHYISLVYLTRLYGIRIKDYDKFSKYLKEAYELQKVFGERDDDQFHYNDIGVESLSPEEKEDFFLGTLKSNEKSNFIQGTATSLINLLKLYADQNDYEKFDNTLAPYLKDNKSFEAFSLYEKGIIFSMAERVKHSQGLFREAYDFQSASNAAKDSLTKLNDQKLIFELEEKYESAIKDSEIANQKNQIDKRTNQRNLFLLTSFSLLLIGGFFYYRFKQKQKISAKDKLIHEQKIKQLEKEKKILSLAAMLEGQEAERVRIAKDLHDGLGGLLSTVKAHFGKIQKEIQKLESMQIYDKATGMIDEACDEVRRISHNLMPGVLRANGLEVAIDQIANELRSAYNLEVEFEYKGDNERLPETTEIFIYRITQELCNNIVKHAQAKNVLMQMIKSESEIQILVEDDGKGFDVEKAKAKDGLGIKSLISRIDFLNGTYEIDARPGEGTSVSVNVPL